MLTILEVLDTELTQLRATFSPLAKRRLEEMETLKTVSNSTVYPKEQVSTHTHTHTHKRGGCSQTVLCDGSINVHSHLTTPTPQVADHKDEILKLSERVGILRQHCAEAVEQVRVWGCGGCGGTYTSVHAQCRGGVHVCTVVLHVHCSTAIRYYIHLYTKWAYGGVWV